MVFLSEEHLLKAIQQKHPSVSFQKPLLEFHSPKVTSFIRSLNTCLFIASCMYKRGFPGGADGKQSVRVYKKSHGVQQSP